VSASVVKPAGALTIGVAGAALLLGVASMISILSVLIGQSGCPGTQPVPSANAEHGVPATYLRLYQRAGSAYGIPWHVLAGIGSIETDHGRSTASGVRSGLNSYGCCAGPMQFNLRNGPPSTWDRYRVDGNRDGTRDVYDPADAIASAANYLRALLRDAGGNLSQAVFGYNHSQAYVNDVLARARAYAALIDDQLVPGGDSILVAGCAGSDLDAPVGPAQLHVAERVSSPRAFRMLPTWAVAASRAPALVDARIYDDVAWILRRYHLRVTAAREPDTERTVTAPPSTSSPPTEPRRPCGTRAPASSPATSAGARTPGARAPALSADSRRLSSSSATTATPTTVPRAPAPSTAPPTSTSPGPHRATAPAARPHRASGSQRSPPHHRFESYG
jgi:hypothetical protein